MAQIYWNGDSRPKPEVHSRPRPEAEDESELLAEDESPHSIPTAGQGSAIPDNLNKSIKIYFNPNSDKDLFV